MRTKMNDHPHGQFKMGYRGILLLHRSKDGEKGNAQRNAIKKISSCPEEFDACVAELREIQRTSHPTHRLYSSVNVRIMDKAIREFKRRQLDIDYEGDFIKGEFYSDIKNRFFSCLMNPLSRGESRFLIDCDTPEEYADALQIDKDLILYEYPTRSGMHLITKPFNPNSFNLKADIKKDDLIYLG